MMNSNGSFTLSMLRSTRFLGSIGFALYIIAVHIYTKEHDHVQLVFIQLVSVFLMSFIMTVLFEKESFHFSYSSSVYWAIIITGVFATSFALFYKTVFSDLLIRPKKQ